MAYQTGTISSAADLVSAIQAFAQSNGWALNSGVLSKGSVYTHIAATDANNVEIRGRRNGLASSPDICPRKSRISFQTDGWPASVEYHMFANTNPDTIWVTLVVNVIEHYHLGFGMLEKYGQWGGGQWFHGQHTTGNDGTNCASRIEDGVQAYYGTYNRPRECALFWNQKDGETWDSADSVSGKCSFLECDLRGYVWEADDGTLKDSTLNRVYLPTIIDPIHRRNPNSFNNQTVLTPFTLFLLNADGHYMNLGHVGHVRWLRLENYNPGDVLEIGSDRWKVFPWMIKDTGSPDGDAQGYGDNTFSTGILGCAVRYDGP